MNRKLVDYLASNGFTYDNNCFCGNLKGYQVSGVCVGNTINLTFYVNVTESESQQIYDWLNNSKRAYSITAMSVDQISVNCTINGLFNSAQKCIELIINGVDYLATFKAPNCCPFCGEPLESDDKGASRLVGIGSNRLYAHENCFDEYAEAVANQEVVAASAPNNYLRGALGAVLGCLLGCAVWAILYYIGIIAFIAAILVSIGATFLWDKFGGKNNKVKIIAIWIITLVMMTLVMFIMYAVDIYAYGLDNGNAFKSFFDYLETDDQYRAAIIYDTAISYVFVIAGNVYTTIQILRTQKLTSQTLIKL